MPLQSFPLVRTFEQALGAVADLAIPPEISPVEVWVSGTAAFTITGAGAGDTAFPLLASTVYQIPCNGLLRVAGTGTLSVMVFGTPNVLPVRGQ